MHTQATHSHFFTSSLTTGDSRAGTTGHQGPGALYSGPGRHSRHHLQGPRGLPPEEPLPLPQERSTHHGDPWPRPRTLSRHASCCHVPHGQEHIPLLSLFNLPPPLSFLSFVFLSSFSFLHSPLSSSLSGCDRAWCVSNIYHSGGDRDEAFPRVSVRC